MAPRVSATLLRRRNRSGRDAICLRIPLLSSLNVPRYNTCVVFLGCQVDAPEILFISLRILTTGFVSVSEDFRPTVCPPMPPPPSILSFLCLFFTPSYIPTRHQSIPSHHVKVVASTDFRFHFSRTYIELALFPPVCLFFAYARSISWGDFQKV